MPIIQIPERCEGCGGCCYGLLVHVTDEDLTQYGTPEALTKPIGAERFLKQVAEDHDRCVALDPETRRCTIYAHRPEVCRSFTRADEGNPKCGDAVAAMQEQQNRREVTAPTRAARAIQALARLLQQDPTLADVSPAERLQLLHWSGRLVALVTPLALTDMAAQVAELRRVVDLVAYQAERQHLDLHHPPGTGQLQDSVDG